MKTEKLTIRKMTTEDLFPLYHVPSDSEVMEYLEPPFSMKQRNNSCIKQVYARLLCYGRWKMRVKFLSAIYRL